METSARFPSASGRAGMYESFYLRAVSPVEPRGVWIRNTVHKRPGGEPTGSVWCTVFDAGKAGPYMHKLSARPAAPAGEWIAIGEHARLGPQGAAGRCGEAEWELRISSLEPPLAHLHPALLYRTPLPRTKLTSPLPAASFEGAVTLAGEHLDVSGWRGMVGHNWGAEHAERWIWLHGTGFEQDESAWLDVALGRILLGGRLTPWVANGALSVGGRRQRLGGLRARPRVQEGAAGCTVELEGRDGARVLIRAEVPAGSAAGWRYADPDGGEHEVINCSVAALTVEAGTRSLRSPFGGAYELGVRAGAEPHHGVALAPFADGEPMRQ